MNYDSLNSLKCIEKEIINAKLLMHDKSVIRNLVKDKMQGDEKNPTDNRGEIASGGLAGAAIGTVASAGGVYFSGITGFSAAGITSGLAAIGGSMIGGILLLGTGVGVCGVLGAGIVSALAMKNANEEVKKRKVELLVEIKEILTKITLYKARFSSFGSNNELEESSVMLNRYKEYIEEDLIGQ